MATGRGRANPLVLFLSGKEGDMTTNKPRWVRGMPRCANALAELLSRPLYLRAALPCTPCPCAPRFGHCNSTLGSVHGRGRALAERGVGLGLQANMTTSKE